MCINEISVFFKRFRNRLFCFVFAREAADKLGRDFFSDFRGNFIFARFFEQFHTLCGLFFALNEPKQSFEV